MCKKKRAYLTDYFWIAVGSLILSIGLNWFLVPAKLSVGGVGSIGTILLYLFRIPLSVTNLAVNAVLFGFGYKYMGKAALLKTVAGILFLSLFLALTEGLWAYTEDRIMASLFGGFLCGLGIGLVVRREGSTGGSDFAALLMHHFRPHISVAVCLLLLDMVVVFVSGIVFRSITVMFYSFFALVVAAKVSDMILTMGDVAKSVYILTDKHTQIAEFVHTELMRGATGIHSQGMYSGVARMMLMCVVSPKELPALVRGVRCIDPGAFVIISDVREVLGEGFKE